MSAPAPKPPLSESASRSTKLRELNETLAVLAAKRARNKLAAYRPYAKQREFHRAGATFRERMLRAANQVGKSWCGCAEDAIHLTGQYPEWWDGKRFDHPVVWIVASETGELTRDGVQRILIGNPENEDEWGTGLIPADCIVDYSRAQGTANALDSVVVRHVSGGYSTLLFKAYAQGRKKFQANTVHGVHLDEECPMEIYTEALTRTNATRGMLMVTFTPLMGGTALVKLFSDHGQPGAESRCLITMELEDAEHYTQEDIERIVASYPEHERDARTKGIPVLGSGLVLPVHEDDFLIDPIPFSEIPAHWHHIGGLDFGYDHPFGASHLTWDKDNDRIIVHRDFAVRLKTPVYHVPAIKGWGGSNENQWMPWAWPGDGLQHDKGSGEELAKQYKAQGLKMLPEPATHPDGGNGLEAGIMDMLDRMQTGRWKVTRTCGLWRAEQRQYYRKDGVIVKLGEDVISSSRYGSMMKRYARQPHAHLRRPRTYTVSDTILG